MGIDLRYPIGILFLAYGLLLAIYGVFRPRAVLDLNVNLIWGGVLAAFGAIMLALAERARRGSSSR